MVWRKGEGEKGEDVVYFVNYQPCLFCPVFVGIFNLNGQVRPVFDGINCAILRIGAARSTGFHFENIVVSKFQKIFYTFGVIDI